MSEKTTEEIKREALMIEATRTNYKEQVKVQIQTMRDRFSRVFLFAKHPQESTSSPAEILGLDPNEMAKEVNIAISRMERNLCTNCATQLLGKHNKFNCLVCGQNVNYKVCYSAKDNECGGLATAKTIRGAHTHFGCGCGQTVVDGVVRYSQTRVS